MNNRKFQSKCNADYQQLIEIANKLSGVNIRHQSRSRKVEPVLIRRIAFAYLNQNLGYGPSMIATACGKEHSTVRYNLNMHLKAMEANTIQAKRYRSAFYDLRLAFETGKIPTSEVVGRAAICSPYCYPGISRPLNN